MLERASAQASMQAVEVLWTSKEVVVLLVLVLVLLLVWWQVLLLVLPW